MGRLVYSAITSLDGYVADADGSFDWGVPDEEVHRAVNDLQRSIGTHLYGRRLYQVMAAWETLPTEGEPTVIGDFAWTWRAAEKIVYSTTLPAVTTARTRLERSFDPAAVAQLKATLDRDALVGGAALAGQAIRAGLVDDIHLFVSPVLVGGGIRALPDDVRVTLELVDQRRFANGVVHLRHRTIRPAPVETGPA